MAMDFARICHRERGRAAFQLRSTDSDSAPPGFPCDGDRIGWHPRGVHVADEQVDLPVRRSSEVAWVKPGLKIGDLLRVGCQITQQLFASGFRGPPSRSGLPCCP